MTVPLRIMFDKVVKYAPSFFQGLKYYSVSPTYCHVYHNIPTAFNMSEPVVKVVQGKVKGAVKKLLDDTPYYSFKGIPYAEAPVGKRRFMAPKPPQRWSETLDATEHGPVCPQYDMMTRQNIDGSENCLLLNIYTKSLNPSLKLPVMVFIHGGGFMSGSGNSEMLGPQFLLQHHIVLVTINYRLEVLGFLCLDTPEVPGNAGLKDQVYALRWVNENILQFGGDPDNVTIFGESAGGASVTYHLHSPMSTGLFHGAIAQSGVSLCDWARGTDAVERAFRLGKILGKETNNVEELLEFLRSVPASQLSRKTLKTLTEDEKHRGIPIHFAPVVEKKFDNVEAFLTEEPMKNLLSKKINDVPLMLGYTSEEGLIMLLEFKNKEEFFDKNPEYFVPREIAQRLTLEEVLAMGRRIKQFYFGDKAITSDDKQALAALYSDSLFVYNIQRFAHFYSKIEATYLYRFSLDTELNLIKKNSILSDLKGVSHAEDLFYFFYVAMNEEVYKENKRLRDIVFNVTKLWATFAMRGKPSRKLFLNWPSYKPSSKEFLDITESPVVGQSPDKERVEFWNKLYSDAGLPHIAKSNL